MHALGEGLRKASTGRGAAKPPLAMLGCHVEAVYSSVVSRWFVSMISGSVDVGWASFGMSS
jgi:hypothetical protein